MPFEKSGNFGTIGGGGIKFSRAISMIEAKYWKCDKILTLRRTRDINIFFGDNIC